MRNISLSLNKMYADYSAGLLERKQFEGAIFRLIQKDVHYLPGWNEEDYCDYVTWLYPRISRAIDNYRNTGSSFEAYINSLIRLTAKEYRSQQVRGYFEDSAVMYTQLLEMQTAEPAPEYNGADGTISAEAKTGDTEKKEKKINNPRQVLILLLKCCSYVSSDFLEKVSPLLGMETETLAAMVNHLREQRVKRIANIEALNERAGNQFYRNILHEKMLQKMEQDSVSRQRLLERLKRGQKRLAKMREKLAQLHPDPSNQQIACVLGISKGTVDAALFNLKKRWNHDKHQQPRRK